MSTEKKTHTMGKKEKEKEKTSCQKKKRLDKDGHNYSYLMLSMKLQCEIVTQCLLARRCSSINLSSLKYVYG